MIDYIKISNRIRDVEGYKKKSRLKFTQSVETETGEIAKPVSYAKIDNIDIRLSDSGYFEVKGSIHKYFNKGVHNFNDFTLHKFYSTIDDLSKLIKVDLWEFKVDTLEIGVNVTPSIDTTIFLNSTYMHGRKPFKDVSMGDGGDYRQASYKNYWVKIYDKGVQYNLPYQLLRFELKLRSDELRRMNLKFLDELKESKMIDRLEKKLFHKFEQIVFIEPSLKEVELPQSQKNKYPLWQNPRYWNELSTNPPSKNSYRREVSLLSSLQLNLTKNVKGDTLQKIQEKWGELVGRVNFPEKDRGNISTSVIDPAFPIKKTCLVTGLDISMQKEGSRFLNITGIKHYHENDPAVFRSLNSRLSSRWNDESLFVQCREIAHSIRNEYHHRRKKLLLQKSSYVDHPTLFDNGQFEDKEILEYYGID